MIEENSLISFMNTPADPAPGDITIFDHLHVPAGWLKTTGQSLLIAEYPELYARYGRRYGSIGDDSFNLPTLLSVDSEFIGYYIYIGTVV